MAAYLSLWWVWVCVALVLGVIELLVPAYIFLGFSVGALIMAGIVAFFPLMNPTALLAIFAILSLVVWIILKTLFRKQSSGARIVTRDINEN